MGARGDQPGQDLRAAIEERTAADEAADEDEEELEASEERAAWELVVLRVGNRWFGLRPHEVREVVIKGFITQLPLAPAHIKGVTMIHGRLVPVITLQGLIPGIESGETAIMLPRLVVVHSSMGEVAVMADEARGLVEVHEAEAQVAERADRHAAILGETEWGEILVCVLDGQKLVEESKHAG